MNRPTRIVVFGVFCLIVGFVSGAKNTMELGLSLLGPDNLEQMREMAEQMGQPLNASQQEDFQVQVKALRKSVYRVGQGIESVMSVVMAGVLMIAGVGLLRERAWALRLTKWWAIYAIPAAAISVVLTLRYVFPEVADVSRGDALLNSAFMLIVLWAFPVLLLRQLPTAEVKAYLAGRGKPRDGAGTMPQATPAPTPAQPQSAPAPPQAAPDIPPAENTWRDDPWNDPDPRG